jgi:hypothetical protein
MTELDLEIPGLAAELISEFGKDIAYKIVGGSVYDPAKSRQVRKEQPFALKAIVEDGKEGRTLSIAGDAFGKSKPGNADTFLCDGSTYIVAEDGVKVIYSGELIALYQITGKPQ